VTWSPGAAVSGVTSLSRLNAEIAAAAGAFVDESLAVLISSPPATLAVFTSPLTCPKAERFTTTVIGG
jgi:hypothetical protein